VFVAERGERESVEHCSILPCTFIIHCTTLGLFDVFPFSYISRLLALFSPCPSFPLHFSGLPWRAPAANPLGLRPLAPPRFPDGVVDRRNDHHRYRLRDDVGVEIRTTTAARAARGTRRGRSTRWTIDRCSFWTRPSSRLSADSEIDTASSGPTPSQRFSLPPVLTIRYDTRCYFSVRSKADISQLNLPHDTIKARPQHMN